MNGTQQPGAPPPPPYGAPATPPAKKGMGLLGWLGIGCVVIIILAGIAFGIGGYFLKKAADKIAKNPGMATAEMVVRMNPDLELVSKDEKANSITVKNKKTGEVVTLSAEDAKNGNFGNFKVKTNEGTTTFNTGENGVSVQTTDEKGQVSTFKAGASTPQNLPSWLPVYPGGTVSGTLDTTNAEGRSAAFTVTTKDSSTQMIDFYDSKLKEAGLTTERSVFSSNGQDTGSVTGKSADGKREASVMISAGGEGTQAMVTFTEKK